MAKQREKTGTMRQIEYKPLSPPQLRDNSQEHYARQAALAQQTNSGLRALTDGRDSMPGGAKPGNGPGVTTLAVKSATKALQTSPMVQWCKTMWSRINRQEAGNQHQHHPGYHQHPGYSQGNQGNHQYAQHHPPTHAYSPAQGHAHAHGAMAETPMQPGYSQRAQAYMHGQRHAYDGGGGGGGGPAGMGVATFAAMIPKRKGSSVSVESLGLGIEGNEQGMCIVSYVVPGSAAGASGKIRPGLVLVGVDEAFVLGLSAHDVIALMEASANDHIMLKLAEPNKVEHLVAQWLGAGRAPSQGLESRHQAPPPPQHQAPPAPQHQHQHQHQHRIAGAPVLSHQHFAGAAQEMQGQHPQPGSRHFADHSTGFTQAQSSLGMRAPVPTPMPMPMTVSRGVLDTDDVRDRSVFANQGQDAGFYASPPKFGQLEGGNVTRTPPMQYYQTPHSANVRSPKAMPCKSARGSRACCVQAIRAAVPLSIIAGLLWRVRAAAVHVFWVGFEPPRIAPYFAPPRPFPAGS